MYITPFERLKNQKMLFVTRQGMMKLVDSEEFQVAKRTVACTKLADDDKLIGMYSTDARVEIYSKFSLDGEKMCIRDSCNRYRCRYYCLS